MAMASQRADAALYYPTTYPWLAIAASQSSPGREGMDPRLYASTAGPLPVPSILKNSARDIYIGGSRTAPTAEESDSECDCDVRNPPPVVGRRARRTRLRIKFVDEALGLPLVTRTWTRPRTTAWEAGWLFYSRHEIAEFRRRSELEEIAASFGRGPRVAYATGNFGRGVARDAKGIAAAAADAFPRFVGQGARIAGEGSSVQFDRFVGQGSRIAGEGSGPRFEQPPCFQIAASPVRAATVPPSKSSQASGKVRRGVQTTEESIVGPCEELHEVFQSMMLTCCGACTQ